MPCVIDEKINTAIYRLTAMKNERVVKMPRNFADRLLDAIDEKQNPSCGGLDPVVSELPPSLRREVLDEYKIGELDPKERTQRLFEATGEAIFRFIRTIIDETYSIFPVFKPNIAPYEKYGPEGVRAFWRTIRYAHDKGVLVIADVKREDIGKTAKHYADGWLGAVELLDGSYVSGFDADAVTLSPYVGYDSVGEFVSVAAEHGKGAFVLDKTSNPTSGQLQDLKIDELHGGRLIYEQIALLIDQWGAVLKGERGYSSLGAVVGANYPEQAARIREMLESGIIVQPAYGAQGGRGRDTVPSFNRDGYGAVVNNSSGMNLAYKREPYRSRFGERNFGGAAREVALEMRLDIVGALQESGKLPQGWERV